MRVCIYVVGDFNTSWSHFLPCLNLKRPEKSQGREVDVNTQVCLPNQRGATLLSSLSPPSPYRCLSVGAVVDREPYIVGYVITSQ